MSIFERLNSINVNDHVEKKNGLSYVSWPFAWAEVKKAYPDATYTIYERPDGVIYWTDGRTAWVKTGLTIEGLEHIEYLPIMDSRNRSIPLENITSFDINKSIQRSLTKAAARHGLGLYIYAGEDLPEAEADAKQAELEAEQNKPASGAQLSVIIQKSTPDQLEKLNAKYGNGLVKMSAKDAGRILTRLKQLEA